VTVPDAPINIVNVQTITNGSQIGLSWNAGVSNGGSSVIDYRIWSDQASGVFFPIVSNLNQLTYTITGLNVGSTYSFKIQARNAFDYSTFSSVVSILVA
jgi:Fibronectin type III domain